MSDVLKHWLNQHGISPKNFGRDFSNGMLIARLLKSLFPKLVELHNYASISNTPQKLNNWSTLNYKVLSKIGLTLSPEVIWQLVQGNPEIVLWLLNSIMYKSYYIKSSRKLEHKAPSQQIGNDSIHEFNMANKMYKQMLNKVQNKIKQLEGSLSTIDEVYKDILDKCYVGLYKQMAHEFDNEQAQSVQKKYQTKTMHKFSKSNKSKIMRSSFKQKY